MVSGEFQPTWPEMEAIFSQRFISRLDAALQEQLYAYPNGIPKGDYYLISEGLLMAALVTMRDNDVEPRATVAQMPQRHQCPACKAMVTFTRGGKVRTHRSEAQGGRCPMSGMPSFGGERA